MKRPSNLEILQAYLNENGGELDGDEGMIEAALDDEDVDDDVEFGYEPPDRSVGITGGYYIERGDGEFTLEWYDDEWPELQAEHKLTRSKSIITRVHYSRKYDESVEEGEDLEFRVTVILEEVSIERIEFSVEIDGRKMHGTGYRVTARYSWEAEAM